MTFVHLNKFESLNPGATGLNQRLNEAMQQLSASELAEKLSVSKGRISQYVAAGKLDGCYTGDGRGRRFDLTKCAVALGRRLDPGQMMGNGAATRRVIAEARFGDHPSDLGPVAIADAPFDRRTPTGATELRPNDPDRYEMARTLKAEEEARRVRRLNESEEGNWVLSSEVERQVARVIAQEVAEFEMVLRDGARAIADRLGVDFKTARQILIDHWRSHRGGRADVLAQAAADTEMSAEERSADA